MALSIIQFAAGFPNWGGSEIHLLNLSMQLRQRGHSVTVASPSGSWVEKHAQEQGLPTVAFTMQRAHDYGQFAQMRRYFQTHRFDVLHAHSPNDFIIPPLAALLTGVPVRVMTRHFPQTIPNRWRAWRYASIYFTQILAVSESVRQTLVESGMPPHRVETIHHGTDVQAFRQTTMTRDESRSAWGLPPNALAVGIVGRVAGEKGHAYLFEALRLLGGAIPIHCVVVGDGPDEDKLKVMAQEMGIADRVIFTGFRSDVNNAILGLDVVVLPSTWEEPCSAVVQQGMALGKPVVGTRAGGTPEMIADGETGLLVPVRDAPALAAALSTLAGDGILRSRMGEAGQARVERLFTLQGMTDKIEELYAVQLARGHSRRGASQASTV
jgi:glycosyltransferase involved in cell wall biosynthesis